MWFIKFYLKKKFFKFTTDVYQVYLNLFNCFVVQTQKKQAIKGNICILQINLDLNILKLHKVCCYYVNMKQVAVCTYYNLYTSASLSMKSVCTHHYVIIIM